MTGHQQNGMGPGARRSGAEAATDRAWRDASDEQPPAALDAAIIAAAGESLTRAGRERSAAAVASVRSPRSFRQWQPLAVAASVAGLAFVLVQTLPREPNVAVPASSQSRNAASESVTTRLGESHSSAKATGEKVAPGAAGSSASRDAARSAAHDASAPTVEPAPAASPAASPAAPDRRQADAVGRLPAADAASAPARPAAQRSATASAGPRVEAQAEAQGEATVPPVAARESSGAELRPDPGAWAARIAALHAAGDLDGAATNLRNFRAAYDHADEYLPAALRDWARTVE